MGVIEEQELFTRGYANGLAQYAIVEKSNGWTDLHDGQARNDFATKEAAFEAAVAAAPWRLSKDMSFM